MFEGLRVRDDLSVDEATHGGDDVGLDVGEGKGLGETGHGSSMPAAPAGRNVVFG